MPLVLLDVHAFECQAEFFYLFRQLLFSSGLSAMQCFSSKIRNSSFTHSLLSHSFCLGGIQSAEDIFIALTTNSSISSTCSDDSGCSRSSSHLLYWLLIVSESLRDRTLGKYWCTLVHFFLKISFHLLLVGNIVSITTT